jgi:hypothetical protein
VPESALAAALDAVTGVAPDRDMIGAYRARAVPFNVNHQQEGTRT